MVQNNKDYFDQSLDEIKLLKYVNDHDPNDEYGILHLFDHFYYKVGAGDLDACSLLLLGPATALRQGSLPLCAHSSLPKPFSKASCARAKPADPAELAEFVA